LKIKSILPVILFFMALNTWAQTRTFDSIFPGIAPETRKAAFTENGYLKSARATTVNSLVCSRPNALPTDIAGVVLQKKPGYMVEALLVIPGKKSLLDVYNALGGIRKLKGRLYQSHTRGEEVPLFEEATRIESDRKNNAIPDPSPATAIPRTDTVFIRLKDANFGNSFYRGSMALDSRGLKYSLTNYKNITFMLVPVIREEKFTAQLYFEIIDEGILIYSFAGAEVSDFVSSRIDMPSAIRKRLEVIISWVVDGLKG